MVGDPLNSALEKDYNVLGEVVVKFGESQPVVLVWHVPLCQHLATHCA